MAIAPTQDVKAYKNYIGGEWVEAASRRDLRGDQPLERRARGHRPEGRARGRAAAIAAARESFDSGVWAEMDPDERVRIMRSVVDKFTEHEDELAELESLQAGMTMRATSTVVIGYCINHWDYFARHAGRPRQEALDPVEFPTHSYNFVLREPIGVCAGIIPWNFPLVMAVWKLAPALAMGNTCVLKPASNTPLTALRLAELLDETDLPKGVVNVITGGGATVGEELASHPDVDKVSFTGSTVVGRRIMQLASSTIKKTTLELGGKSPNIVFEDANIEAAVDGALWATFFHQGQVCESGTRLLLPESIHDEFVEALVERAKQIKIGDALDYDTDMGPLVSAAQLETTENYVRIGQEEGAKLVLGGKRPDDAPDGGFYYEPTIFTDVDNSMTIAQEEIFGPVLSVIKFTERRRGRADRQRLDLRPGLGGLVGGLRPLPGDGQEAARRHGLDQRPPPDQLHRPVRRLQAVGHRPRARLLRPRRVHRGQARARGPHARPRAQDVRGAAVRAARVG